MKALVQRVKDQTKIAIANGPSFSFDGPGLVVLLGWLESDSAEAVLQSESWILERILGLRIFPDAEGKMNLNLESYLKDDSRGGILWVSQFTLAGKLESGFRPSFIEAMQPERAKVRWQEFRASVEQKKLPFINIFGDFGADMDLSFTNWGPVSLNLSK